MWCSLIRLFWPKTFQEVSKMDLLLIKSQALSPAIDILNVPSVSLVKSITLYFHNTPKRYNVSIKIMNNVYTFLV